jgi:hypothetical protein
MDPRCRDAGFLKGLRNLAEVLDASAWDSLSSRIIDDLEAIRRLSDQARQRTTSHQYRALAGARLLRQMKSARRI